MQETLQNTVRNESHLPDLNRQPALYKSESEGGAAETKTSLTRINGVDCADSGGGDQTRTPAEQTAVHGACGGRGPFDAESWLPVRGYEGTYQVSSLGRVRRLHKTRRPKVLRQQESDRGYFTICLSKDAKVTRHRVCRLVADAFHGPIPRGLEVNHIDGDKGNDAAVNLAIVTRRDNMQHAIREGLWTPPGFANCAPGVAA